MDKNKTASGTVGDCSDEQLIALKRLRDFASSRGFTEAEYDDHYLLRFLRARGFVYEKAEKMFADFLEWRVKNNVSHIMEFRLQELPEVRVHYPHGYHRTDKQGRPIYIERIGMLKLNQLFNVTNESRLISYYIQSYEMLLKRIFPACSEAAGRRIDRTVTILDLKGFSMKMLSKQVYNFIQLASKLAQENYPEILGQMFIVNAPMLFSGIWGMIKPWIDEKTRNKITIIGSGFKDKLLEIIDVENLPDFLGGTSKVDLGANVGPWNPSAKEFFPIHENQDDNQTVQQSTKVDSDEDNENEEDQEKAFDDFAALRNALSGNISGPGRNMQGNDQQGKFEITTQGAHFKVSQTPLNTQVDESDDGM